MSWLYGTIYGKPPGGGYSAYGGFSKAGPFVKFPRHKKMSQSSSQPGLKRRRGNSGKVVQSSGDSQRILNEDKCNMSIKIGKQLYFKGSKSQPVFHRKNYSDFSILGDIGKYHYSALYFGRQDEVLPCVQQAFRHLQFTYANNTSAVVVPVPLISGLDNAITGGGTQGTFGTGGIIKEYELYLGKRVALQANAKLQLLSGSNVPFDVDLFWVTTRKAQFTTGDVLTYVAQSEDWQPSPNPAYNPVAASFTSEMPANRDQSFLYDFRKSSEYNNVFKTKFLKRLKFKPGSTIDLRIKFPKWSFTFDEQRLAASNQMTQHCGGILLMRMRGSPIVATKDSVKRLTTCAGELFGNVLSTYSCKMPKAKIGGVSNFTSFETVNDFPTGVSAPLAINVEDDSKMDVANL